MKKLTLPKARLCAFIFTSSIISVIHGASPAGDVVGKVSVGYQGWFACAGDGSPNNNWTHWANDSSQLPSPSNPHAPSWPDVREYTATYQTGYAALGNGQPAKLFSSFDQQTVNTHVLWMQQNGIDTIALQRFGGGNTDAVAPKVRLAAETYGRKFYLMYDFNGFNDPASLEADWNNKGKAFTTSTAYAKQNGKPVVCMWGIGMKMTPAQNLELINFFKGQGCYVIGGVGRGWRTETTWISTYHALNMISPWLIGAVGNVGDADNIYNTYMAGDQADCNANGIDYQPCILPGDLSIGQRAHGDLMWRMFYNAKRVGAQGFYISMFDEYCEGNQIAKTAENAFLTPSNFPGKSLDEDGTPCSADYYLRLTGDGGKMLKGTIALTSVRPTETGGSSPQNNGVFHLICKQSGKALDNGGSTTEGSQVTQWADQGGNTNQEWKLVDVGGGFYNLVCQKSGKALDNSGSAADGTIMKQWTVQGGNQNQQWKFVSTGNGCYNIICRVGGETLDNGGSATDGTAVKQWNVQGGNVNQQWRLKFIR
jgi:hypothetical protein